MRRLLCNLFGHIRHRRRARLTYEGWRSPCIFCHTSLLRVGPGEWQPYRRRDDATSGQLDFLGKLDRMPKSDRSGRTG